MDSFEWNKIIAAVLVGGLLFMGVNILSESMFEGEEEVMMGGEEEQTASAEQPAEEMTGGEATLYALLVDANVDQGARSFRKCQACHTVNDGGGNRIGPNLYDVVGNNVAHRDDYAYSSAMQEKGGTWTFDALNEFLASPSTAIPGTKMSFAGIRTEEERANLIAYLREQSASPVPLPEVAMDEPAMDDMAAEDAMADDSAGE